MRVLVTGAAGFLASHLTDRLLADGHHVIGVDNLCTSDGENIQHLRNDHRFAFEQRDICEPFDPGPVEFVFNFASPASPPEYLRIGIETLRVGSHGVENAISIAHKYSAGFLQASTSECYGDPLQHPQVESYWGNVNPVGPRSVYDESKRFAEAMVMAFHRSRAVNTRIVRIFNTYGPRLRPGDGRVVSTLMTQALRGEPMTIYGDGKQTRSFCYVDDLIEGIVRLSRVDDPFPVNIGNPTELTILECALTIAEVTTSASKIVFRPLPQDDPVRRRPDISRARQLLGWEPQVTLRDGLAASLEYFKNKASEAGGPGAA